MTWVVVDEEQTVHVRAILENKTEIRELIAALEKRLPKKDIENERPDADV